MINPSDSVEADKSKKNPKPIIVGLFIVILLLLGAYFFLRSPVDLPPIFSSNPKPTPVPTKYFSLHKDEAGDIVVSGQSKVVPITNYDIVVTYPSSSLKYLGIDNKMQEFSIVVTEKKGSDLPGSKGQLIITGSVPIEKSGVILNQTPLVGLKFEEITDTPQGSIQLVYTGPGKTDDSNLIAANGNDVIDGIVGGSLALSSLGEKGDVEAVTADQKFIVKFVSGQSPVDLKAVVEKRDELQKTPWGRLQLQFVDTFSKKTPEERLEAMRAIDAEVGVLIKEPLEYVEDGKSVFEFTLEPGYDLETAISRYQTLTEVVYAEPNHTLELFQQ